MISSNKLVVCKTSSSLADGAGAAAAFPAPPSRAAMDGGRLGAATAKATSKVISMELVDGAIALWMWMRRRSFWLACEGYKPEATRAQIYRDGMLVGTEIGEAAHVVGISLIHL